MKISVIVTSVIQGEPCLFFSISDHLSSNRWVKVDEFEYTSKKSESEIIDMFNKNNEKFKTPEQEIADLKAELAKYKEQK